MSSVIIRWNNCTNASIECERSVLMELHEEYSFEVPSARFTPQYRSGRWDGWIRLVHLDGSLPVGLVSTVMKFLKGAGHECRISKEFQLFKHKFDFTWESLNLGFEPWDHQKEAVRLALERKRQIILSPTSSGKSLSIYGIAKTLSDNQLKTLIVVPSIMLVNQLKGDFGDYSSHDESWDVDERVHLIAEGAQKDTDKNLTISTWQSLQYVKNASWFEQWDAIIVDEAHGAKATELKNIMDKSVNAFYRIGLTGTLDGTLTSEMALVAMFGPVTRVATTKELQDKGIISNVAVKAVVLKYPEADCKIFAGKMIDGKRVKPTYDEEMEYIYANTPRNVFISNLVKSTSGNTLVLVSKIENHGKPLFEMMKEICQNKEVYLIYGKTESEDRESIRKLAETKDNIVIIATYKLFSTGVSIKRLHNIVFGSPSKSVIRVLQSIGRVLRLHESKLIANVFDIVDDFRGKKKTANYAVAHFLERVKIYQKEKFKFEMFDRII